MKVRDLVVRIVGHGFAVSGSVSVVYIGSSRQRRTAMRADQRSIRRQDGLGANITRQRTVKLCGHVTAR